MLIIFDFLLYFQLYDKIIFLTFIFTTFQNPNYNLNLI